MPTQLESYNAAALEPALYPERARIDAARLGPSLTLSKGTVLGKKTSDKKLYAYAQVNDVQTVAIAGTLSAGTGRIGLIKSDGSYVKTTSLAYNASTSAIATAINAVLGASAVAVGGTDMSAFTITFSGTGYAGILQPLVTLETNGITGATTASVAHSAVTTGIEVPVAILKHDVATDANGKHYLGTSAVANGLNLAHADTTIYTGGVFDPADLTGWDNYCLTAFGARILNSSYILIP